MIYMNCGCDKRRKALKRFIKTAFKGGNSVPVSKERVITEKYVDKMNAKFGKK